jgi:hypothetical protein
MISIRLSYQCYSLDIDFKMKCFRRINNIKKYPSTWSFLLSQDDLIGD